MGLTTILAGCVGGGSGAGGPSAASPPQPAPTRVSATFAGVWRGTYRGGVYRRAGSLDITFTDYRSARAGHLVIGTSTSSAATTRRLPNATRVPLSTAAADGGAVSFRSELFFDEGCGCTLTLTFVGQAHGDTLVGRFIGESAATVVPENRGRWRAVRQVREHAVEPPLMARSR